jgi:hypothetical protein
MNKIAIGLLIFTISFLLAYIISSSMVTDLITGTTTGDNLITNLWQLTLAGSGIALLVQTAFKDVA